MKTNGIDRDQVRKLSERARRDVDEGILPSAQIALALDGEIVHFETFGDATDETRYAVFSATKAFVVGLFWQLLDEGRVDLRARVAEVVPEFGTLGKDAVTVEQVLLHTSGFPSAPMGPPAWSTREGRLERFGRWKLNWEPGTRYEYHPTSAHWVLVEIIDRVADGDYRDLLEDRITAPLGLPRVLGLARGDQENIARVVAVGEPATPDELRSAFGIDELPANEVTPEALEAFNAPEIREVGVPGGGGVMRAAELAIFYQELLHRRRELWSPEALADGTERVRNRLPDPLMGIPANRTLGLVQAGDDGFAHVRGFGRTVSPRAFGHNGAGGQIAWADPETGLSFAYCTNGYDRHEVRQPRRGTALSSLAALCRPT